MAYIEYTNAKGEKFRIVVPDGLTDEEIASAIERVTREEVGSLNGIKAAEPEFEEGFDDRRYPWSDTH